MVALIVKIPGSEAHVTVQVARFMGQYGAHLGPVGPRWAPYWPHELCYQGGEEMIDKWYQNRSSLVQLMACHLFRVNPLPNPMITRHKSDCEEQTLVKTEVKNKHFLSTKCVFESLQNIGRVFYAMECWGWFYVITYQPLNVSLW